MLTFAAGDLHIGEGDPRATSTFLAACVDAKPDKVVLLGDICDCHELHKNNRGQRIPDGSHEVGWELDETRRFLRMLRKAVPGARIWYLEGNHEDRWSKTLACVAPHLVGVAPDLPALLELQSLGISWIPYTDVLHLDGVVYLHGYKCNQNVAYLNLAAFNETVIQGHSHRLTMRSRTDGLGRVRYGCEAGHLRDPRCDYMRSRPDWQQGWVMVQDGHPSLVTMDLAGVARCGSRRWTPQSRALRKAVGRGLMG